MSFSGRFFIRSTLALLLVGFVALLVIVGLSIYLGERSQTYFDQTIAARDARATAVELRNALVTAESSQRGFIATGNEIYLAPYNTARANAQDQLATVSDVLASYGQSSDAVETLKKTIMQKFAEMDETIALKRNRRDDEAMSLFRTNRGKALTDQANVFFTGLIRAADERLTAGVAEQRANAQWLRLVSITAGIVIVIVVGGAAVAVWSYTRDLAAARKAVVELNAGLEQRVQNRTSELARANDEIQRFAYIVTHDLRAPLVNIMGFTKELEVGVGSLQALIDKSGAAAIADPVADEARIAAKEDLPEAISFIRSSTQKMDSLIGAILKISREGRRSLRSEPIDLEELVRHSAASLQHQIDDAEGRVDTDIKAPPLRHDRLSIEQIVGNLFDNAVKYRAPNRPLVIKVTARPETDGRVAIEVADNGRGIAEHDRERVFELFRRSGLQDQPGEGIGLAYVRTVVRNLGGEITMTSSLGNGTTFRVVLPAALRLTESPAA